MSELGSDRLKGGVNSKLIQKKEDVLGDNQVTSRHYRVTRWNNMPKYECAYCSFDTLKLHRMEEHLEEHKEQQPERSILLYDQYGKPI